MKQISYRCKKYVTCQKYITRKVYFTCQKYVTFEIFQNFLNEIPHTKKFTKCEQKCQKYITYKL